MTDEEREADHRILEASTAAWRAFRREVVDFDRKPEAVRRLMRGTFLAGWAAGMKDAYRLLQEVRQ